MSKNDMVMVPRELAQFIVDGGYCWPEAMGKLEAILNKPAEQHQTDPVALPARLDTAQMDGYQSPYDRGWNACLDEIAKPGPLFTHADSGEVESTPECFCVEHGLHIETLRDQLAEQDALLRGYQSLLRQVMPCLAMSTNSQAASYMRQIDAALSASAEPSAMAERIKSAACPECASKPCMCAELIAPAVIDERAEFEAWGTDRGYFNLKREHSGKYKFHTAWAAWEGWQARAALTSSAEPSAPVAQCTNEDSWNCKYCRNTESCEALKDPRNFGKPSAPVEPLYQKCTVLKDSNVRYSNSTAPVEIDERAAFERHVILTTGRPVDSELRRHPIRHGEYECRTMQTRWMDWQARAALEHKP